MSRQCGVAHKSILTIALARMIRIGMEILCCPPSKGHNRNGGEGGHTITELRSTSNISDHDPCRSGGFTADQNLNMGIGLMLIPIVIRAVVE